MYNVLHVDSKVVVRMLMGFSCLTVTLHTGRYKLMVPFLLSRTTI